MVSLHDIKGKYFRNQRILIKCVSEKSANGLIIGKHAINGTNVYFDRYFYYFYNISDFKYYAMQVKYEK